MGETLPTTPIRRIYGEDAPVEYLQALATQGDRCALVVLSSTSCYSCRLMRVTWPARARSWVDSVGGGVNLLWIGGDDVTEQQAFYAGFDFDGVALASVVGDAGRVLGRLGLFATPTTYLLDRMGRLRQGVLGDRLPSVTAGVAACG